MVVDCTVPVALIKWGRPTYPFANSIPGTQLSEITLSLFLPHCTPNKDSHWYIGLNASIWSKLINVPPYTLPRSIWQVCSRRASEILQPSLSPGFSDCAWTPSWAWLLFVNRRQGGAAERLLLAQLSPDSASLTKLSWPPLASTVPSSVIWMNWTKNLKCPFLNSWSEIFLKILLKILLVLCSPF